MTVSFTPEILSWPLFNKPERLQVMLAILLSSEDDGSIDPGLVSRLPLITGLSVVTVQRSIQDLIEAGILACVTGIDIPMQLIVTNLPEGISSANRESCVSTPSHSLPPVPVPPKQKRQSSIRSVTYSDFPEGWWQLINVWLKYKRSEKRGSYKTMSTVNTFYRHMLEATGSDLEVARRAVNYSISNNYMGLVLDPSDKHALHKSTTTNHKPLSSYEQQRQSSRDIYLAAEAGVSFEAVAGVSLASIPDISPCDGTAPLVPAIHVGER